MKTGLFPLKIHPLFWITAALIGFLSGLKVGGVFFLIGVIFVSVVVHEMGHALMARLFGLSPRIELGAFGGMTMYEAKELSYGKQFLIVLFGPLFGFFLCLLAFGLLQWEGWRLFFPSSFNDMLAYGLLLTYKVNLFWTLINLIPVLPLDGGQLVRIGCEAIWGVKGIRYCFLLTAIVGGAISILFFLLRHYVIGGLFFLFAFQSIEAFRNMKIYSENDRNALLRKKLEEGEELFIKKDKEKAFILFQALREETKTGFIYVTSSEYLAFLKEETGSLQEVYEILSPLKKEISLDGLVLLQKAAFEVKDFAMVEEIGPICFQQRPSQEIALRTARACALLGKAKSAVGWLEAAFQEGLDRIGDILKEEDFNLIRNSDVFKSILNRY